MRTLRRLTVSTLVSAGLLLGAGAFLPQTTGAEMLQPTDASAQDCRTEVRVVCDFDGCRAELRVVCEF